MPYERSPIHTSGGSAKAPESRRTDGCMITAMTTTVVNDTMAKPPWYSHGSNSPVLRKNQMSPRSATPPTTSSSGPALAAAGRRLRHGIHTQARAPPRRIPAARVSVP